MAGALLEGFASVYVPTVLKQKELEDRRAYEEEKERKARAAAAAKAAKAQEAKDKKLAKNAKILAKQYSGSDNNGEALVFFTQQLQLTDGDVGDVMSLTERMIEDGRLQFVTKTESRPLQGPDVPSDFQTSLTVGDKTYDQTGSGTPLTVGKLDNIANNENNSDAVRDEAGQMSEIFAPVSEEPNMDTPVEGIEITPFGQQDDKLDYTRLATLDDIEMYRLEIEGGDIKLSEEALAVIDAREKSLKSGRTDDNIQKAFSDPKYTGGRLQVLGRTEQGKQSDEYLALLSLKEMHDGKAEKPYDAILEAQSIKDAADVRELQRIERIASELGATDAELAAVRSEIAARSGERTPIEYSSLTANNYMGTAKELEEAGRVEDANLVREFGAAQFAEKPLSIVELGELNEATLSALSKSVTDEGYLARINTVIAEGTAIKDRDAAAEFSISKFDDVKLDTLTVERDNTPEGTEARAQLDALVKLREQQQLGTMPELNLDGGFFMTTYTITDENGETVTVMSTTAPSAQGIYDIENRRLVPPDAITRNDSMKTLGDMADLVAQANDKTLKPVREARSQTATMLESARRLESFVDPKQGGNPAILTTVGGDVTKLIDRLGNEYEALNNLYLSGADNETVMQYIDNQASQFAETASMSSQFQAELLKFAYTYASAVLEQRGTGLSNNDFKKALQIVSAGSSYETFSNNLRSQSLQRINTVSRKISDLDTEPQIVLLDRYDPELTRGFKVPMPDYLASRGLGDMVEWANGKATPVKGNDGDGDVPVETPPTVGSNLSKFKNDPIFETVKQKIQNAPADRIDQALEIYSKRFNIPADVLRKEFELN
jgi:hypothetical protein